MFLDIFILHYKNFEALKKTIASLNVSFLALNDYEAHTAPLRVSILDNGNLPKEADEVKAWYQKENVAWHDKLFLHRSVWNRGFAGGHNELWKRMKPTGFVFFLNSDIEVPAYFLKNIFGTLKHALPNTKIVYVPKIEEGGKLYSGGHFLKLRATGKMANETSPPKDWDFASGAALLVPAQSFSEAGLWNENFFFYGEDVELGLRLKQMGWNFQNIPGLTIRHQGRGSFANTKVDYTFDSLKLHFKSRALLIKYCLSSPLKPLSIFVVSLEILFKSFVWLCLAPFKDFQIKKIQTVLKTWFLEGLTLIYKKT